MPNRATGIRRVAQRTVKGSEGNCALDVPINGTYQRDYDAGLKPSDSAHQCLRPGCAGVALCDRVQTIDRMATGIGEVTAYASEEPLFLSETGFGMISSRVGKNIAVYSFRNRI